MTTTPSRSQPWLDEYQNFVAKSCEGGSQLGGTTHGFKKGEEVIMDGNSGSPQPTRSLNLEGASEKVVVKKIGFR